MKVSECRGCKHCVRRVWTDYYKPLSYHAIGINHAYAYCQKHKARVLEVKKCDEIQEKERKYEN